MLHWYLCHFCCFQIPLGLVEGRVTHIIWPPSKISQVERKMPEGRIFHAWFDSLLYWVKTHLKYKPAWLPFLMWLKKCRLKCKSYKFWLTFCLHFLLFTMLLFCTLCKRLDFLVVQVEIWTICVVSYVLWRHKYEWRKFLWLHWGICILRTWKFLKSGYCFSFTILEFSVWRVVKP